jgi:hypothetical protein
MKGTIILNMQEKNKILILFDGWHLAYSPTINQLYDLLSSSHDVTIVAETSPKFTDQQLPGKNVIYFECIKRRPSFIYKIYYALLAMRKKKKKKEAGIFRRHKFKFCEYYDRFRLVKKLLQTNQYERVLAVDFKNLFICSLLNVKVDFISMEIGIAEYLVPEINTSLINCVIIQSKERFEYLFTDKKLKTFYIQNSPVYKERVSHTRGTGLLYGGTAWNPFGIYHCLNYLRRFKEETLTIQGAVPKGDRKKMNKEYAELLSEKRLVINDSYIENDNLVDYFSNFDIGFCFYNFEVKWINHFNYRSAPSGKLFKYLAAGVPVVCSDISGFQFVKEFNCGI